MIAVTMKGPYILLLIEYSNNQIEEIKIVFNPKVISFFKIKIEGGL